MHKHILILEILLTTIITIPTYAYRSRNATNIWTDSSRTTLAKEICDSDTQGCPSALCWLPNGTYYDNKGTFTETCTGGGSTYTSLEYIESTGSQYINLPYTFKNTDEMGARVAMMYPGTDVSDKYFVAPSTWNNRSGNRFALGGIHYDRFTFGYGNVTTGRTPFLPHTIKDMLPHLYTYKNYMFKMEDLGLSGNVSSTGFTGETTNLKLFYGYNAPTKCKIYSYYHIREGEYLINLIPVKRNSDGAIGMYDTVNDKFYGNSGTGTFTAGPAQSSFDQTYAFGLTDCLVMYCFDGKVDEGNGGCVCPIGMIEDANGACGKCYDIGLGSCVNGGVAGTASGYWDFGVNTSNTSTYGLTAGGQWGVTFSYGKIKGISSCNNTSGTYGIATSTNFNNTANGKYCWCKMTSPVASRWVFLNAESDVSSCTVNCAYNCSAYVQQVSVFRSAVYGSIGQ